MPRNSHLIKHRLCDHLLYGVWEAMKQRCYNKNHRTYKWYGGSGVKICDEWRNNFVVFYNWAIQNGWAKGLELDKDIKGDGLLYSPETCCFVSHKENLKAKNVDDSLRSICLEKNLNYITVYLRINKLKWSKEKALSVPIRKWIKQFV